MKRQWILIALLCTASMSTSASGTQVSLLREGALHGYDGVFRLHWLDQETRLMRSQRVGGAGVFNIRVTGAPEGQYRNQLFCVDVTTYISGSQWTATRHLVPPSPYDPPYSIRDAVELFHLYEHRNASGVEGQGWRTNATTAAAIQLALWEVTHESNWRTGFSVNSWFGGGDFHFGEYSSSLHSARDAAGTMLTALYGRADFPGTNRAYYYHPHGSGVSQALLGEAPPIPEPGTLILLGLGLTAAGVGVIGRRRRE